MATLTAWDLTPPPDEAAAALDLVSSSRADLADRLVTPWYHPVLGLLGGAAVLGYGTGSTGCSRACRPAP